MLHILATMLPAHACEEPPLFETDLSLVAVPRPDALGPIQVSYGRGPRSDDPSCADDHSWMEIDVEVPSDVGVRVEVENTQGGGTPQLGALQGGVFQADEPIVLYWPETDQEARRTLHYTLWLTPVSAAGEDGPFSELEGYDDTRGLSASEGDDDEVLPICATAPLTSVWSWWPTRR